MMVNMLCLIYLKFLVRAGWIFFLVFVKTIMFVLFYFYKFISLNFFCFFKYFYFIKLYVLHVAYYFRMIFVARSKVFFFIFKLFVSSCIYYLTVVAACRGVLLLSFCTVKLIFFTVFFFFKYVLSLFKLCFIFLYFFFKFVLLLVISHSRLLHYAYLLAAFLSNAFFQFLTFFFGYVLVEFLAVLASILGFYSNHLVAVKTFDINCFLKFFLYRQKYYFFRRYHTNFITSFGYKFGRRLFFSKSAFLQLVWLKLLRFFSQDFIGFLQVDFFENLADVFFSRNAKPKLFSRTYSRLYIRRRRRFHHIRNKIGLRHNITHKIKLFNRQFDGRRAFIFSKLYRSKLWDWSVDEGLEEVDYWILFKAVTRKRSYFTNLRTFTQPDNLRWTRSFTKRELFETPHIWVFSFDTSLQVLEHTLSVIRNYTFWIFSALFSIPFTFTFKIYKTMLNWLFFRFRIFFVLIHDLRKFYFVLKISYGALFFIKIAFLILFFIIKQVFSRLVFFFFLTIFNFCFNWYFFFFLLFFFIFRMEIASILTKLSSLLFVILCALLCCGLLIWFLIIVITFKWAFIIFFLTVSVCVLLFIKKFFLFFLNVFTRFLFSLNVLTTWFYNFFVLFTSYVRSTILGFSIFFLFKTIFLFCFRSFRWCVLSVFYLGSLLIDWILLYLFLYMLWPFVFLPILKTNYILFFIFFNVTLVCGIFLTCNFFFFFRFFLQEIVLTFVLFKPAFFLFELCFSSVEPLQLKILKSSPVNVKYPYVLLFSQFNFFLFIKKWKLDFLTRLNQHKNFYLTLEKGEFTDEFILQMDALPQQQQQSSDLGRIMNINSDMVKAKRLFLSFWVLGDTNAWKNLRKKNDFLLEGEFLETIEQGPVLNDLLLTDKFFSTINFFSFINEYKLYKVFVEKSHFVFYKPNEQENFNRLINLTESFEFTKLSYFYFIRIFFFFEFGLLRVYFLWFLLVLTNYFYLNLANFRCFRVKKQLSYVKFLITCLSVISISVGFLIMYCLNNCFYYMQKLLHSILSVIKLFIHYSGFINVLILLFVCYLLYVFYFFFFFFDWFLLRFFFWYFYTLCWIFL